jgi:hypothetical protein
MVSVDTTTVSSDVKTIDVDDEEDDSSRQAEDHVWFEDRWMVASLCDE